MKFTKQQQDYIKHCGEHFEILTGGRGHSKTKEIIEDMQKEIERLNDIINTFEEDLERELRISEENSGLEYKEYILIKSTLEKMLKYFKELKESGNNE